MGSGYAAIATHLVQETAGLTASEVAAKCLETRRHLIAQLDLPDATVLDVRGEDSPELVRRAAAGLNAMDNPAH
jgi:hypothetical protein